MPSRNVAELCTALSGSQLLALLSFVPQQGIEYAQFVSCYVFPFSLASICVSFHVPPSQHLSSSDASQCKHIYVN